ncbi:MAG: hypothetical protein AB8G86_16100 [Saprospiraceae bacterium]
MKIINPIYDLAFKYLMQNERIAKKVLSTLLECDILELALEQQEIIAVDEFRDLKLYRLDFSALIVNQDGTTQRVLIELQKSKLPTNLLRFRSYLGNTYTKRETKTAPSGDEKIVSYPIIAIYILGYNVVDIPYLAINIDRRITNTVTKEEITVDSDFVELLTHKTRIIQVQRLGEKRRSKLEQFLLLFNQAWAVKDTRYIIDLKEIPDSFSDVVDYLKGPVADEAFRRKLEAEQEIDDIFKQQEIDLKLARQQRAEALEKAEAAKQEAETEKQKAKTAKQETETEKQKTKAAKREAETAKQEAEAEKQKAEAEKQKAKTAFLKLATYLITQNAPLEEIIQQTGLSKTEILKLKK